MMQSAYYHEKAINGYYRKINRYQTELDAAIKKHGTSVIFDDVLLFKIKTRQKTKMNMDLKLTEMIWDATESGYDVKFDKDKKYYHVTRKEEN